MALLAIAAPTTVAGEDRATTRQYGWGPWDLGQDCEPTAITIEPSAAHKGIVPDTHGVERLITSFRTLVVDKRPGLWVPRYSSNGMHSRLGRAAAALPTAVIILLLIATLMGAILSCVQRWGATAGAWRSAIVLALGVVAIVLLLPYDPPPAPHWSAADWLHANALVLTGVLPLVLFLWFVAAGFFSYGSARREDWPALLVFVLAWAIRAGYARHGNEELELYFYYGAVPNRHSVIHPLYQMFVQSLSAYPYWFMMHANGFLGALATLPLFLFVRQRSDSRMAAGMVAGFYAVHPIIVQIAPTGGHYALALSTWFAGLALLTVPEIHGRQLFGGAVLLGLAATSRAEGCLYLVASLFLVDARALLTAIQRHKTVAVLSTCVGLGLMALHAHYCFPSHVAPGATLPSIGPVRPLKVLRAAVYSVDFNDPVLVGLMWLGALAGVVDRRFRIGLQATLATFIVVWPMAEHTTEGFTVIHRLVPTCALQVIAAGVGAAWLTSSFPSRLRHHWAAAVPGLAVVVFLFVTHLHEIRQPNAVTEEFWMLRNHLAADGSADGDCALLFVGSTMDTDIHNFEQVLPGMPMVHCESRDCVDLVSDGGCFYYLRNLNCFFSESEIPRECFEHGKTPDAGCAKCLRPRCRDLERSLRLSPVDERTVDVYAAFRGDPRWPRWPKKADIALYKVLGVRTPTASPAVVDSHVGHPRPDA